MAVRARPDNLTLDHPAGERLFPFDELWDLRDELRATCRRMLGDAGRADDVVQDTFLRALANAGELERHESYAPWLATVARRRSVDEIRGRRRLRLVPATPEPEPSHGADPVEQVLRQEALERVRVALDQLNRRERQLLLRQVAHGLSLSELAAEEATTIASVRSVLTRARAKLRAAVERDGPLGAAPMPGVVAAVRRRLHRWASRLDGRAPMLAGAGSQFGDMALAAIAAIAVLVAGTSNAAGTELGMHVHASAATPAEPGDDAPHGSDDAPAKKPTTTTTSSTTTTTAAPSVVPPPDWDTVPTLPHDGVSHPKDVLITTFTSSADRRTVFASGGTDEGGWAVLRSDDNGVTWTRLDTPPNTTRLLVPPTYPGEPTLFVVNSASLLRSDDDGRHFYPVTPTRLGVAAVAPNYAQNRRVLVAGASLLEYEASAFPGAVRPLPAVPPSPLVGSIVGGWDYETAGTTLVGGTAVVNGQRVAAVYACTPTTCAFHASLGWPEDPARLLRSDANPGAVLAWRGDRLQHSSDGGRTFSSVALSGISVDNIGDGGPGELFLTGLDLGAGSSVHRSTDGGRTWLPFGVGTPVAKGTRAIVRLASGRLLAGAKGVGLHCSDDGGLSWSAGCT